jgi:hypothetical protein
LDNQILGDAKGVESTWFGAETRQAIRQRVAFLVEEGFIERQGDRILIQRHLLSTLRTRELASVAKAIESETGLSYHEALEGDRVTGVYRRTLMLASGRFAMLDDGVGFSLVPWRPVIEEQLGREIGGVVSGTDISWDFSRSRGLGR